MNLKHKFNDGGKADACLGTAHSGDCAIRAAAIALGQSYRTTKSEMNELLIEMTGGLERSCNNGTPTSVLHRYMTERGYELTLTPKTYLQDHDFSGRTVIAVLARHYVGIVDNVVLDTWDSRKCRKTKCGSPKLSGFYEKRIILTLDELAEERTRLKGVA
jgi:hypothetical protein